MNKIQQPNNLSFCEMISGDLISPDHRLLCLHHIAVGDFELFYFVGHISLVLDGFS